MNHLTQYHKDILLLRISEWIRDDSLPPTFDTKIDGVRLKATLEKSK
jgi:hypothetical protein